MIGRKKIKTGVLENVYFLKKVIYDEIFIRKSLKWVFGSCNVWTKHIIQTEELNKLTESLSFHSAPGIGMFFILT